MLAQTQRLYTVEEYLDFEVQSEQRHEYINGEILLMTGGTPEPVITSDWIYTERVG